MFAGWERGQPIVVDSAMANPLTLPALGAGLLLAAAAGVHMGESSIALINPIHFQGPAVHPRDRGAAIDESRIAPRPPAFASLYGWEEGRAARAEDCGDCDALRARDAYAVRADHGYGYARSYAEPAVQVEVVVKPDGPPEPRSAWADSSSAVARYAYYQVESLPDDEADAVTYYEE